MGKAALSHHQRPGEEGSPFRYTTTFLAAGLPLAIVCLWLETQSCCQAAKTGWEQCQSEVESCLFTPGKAGKSP